VNQKVLFVDDEPDALELYTRMLEREFEIATAPSGEDGLLSLRNDGPFAIVVSDLQMDGMDGVQFLKRVRQVAPNTMRLLLTGHVDLPSAAHAINEGGIFRLLMKPCEHSILKEAITKALACYHEQKEVRVRVELPVQLQRLARESDVRSAHTVDISNCGVRIAGLLETLEPGEILNLECGNRTAPFRVAWVGSHGRGTAGEAGLECLAVDADIWRLNSTQLEVRGPLIRAREVQRGLLPQHKPPLTTLDYEGNCIQARMVGGDYYDFLHPNPGEVGFVLADVAGKGIEAALLMASLQGSIHTTQFTGTKSLPQVLAAVNLHFYQHSAQDRYATFFWGCYSDATRMLHYVNCGHNPPVLLRDGGAVERLNATATVLGLFPDWECHVAHVQLEKGDLLTIYTDGITETTGHDGKEFGETRLLETLRKNRNLDAAHILRNVENTVELFRSGEQADDLTLVIARAL
jgi:CheY-like chemotaxis protein